MEFHESDRFIKQFNKLSKHYHKIGKDLDDLKTELPNIAFKEFPPLNKSLIDIPTKNGGLTKTWLIRFTNSDTNRGKSHGYRSFYCRAKDNGLLFLGIFMRNEIDEGQVNSIAKELIAAAEEAGDI